MDFGDDEASEERVPASEVSSEELQTNVEDVSSLVPEPKTHFITPLAV